MSDVTILLVDDERLVRSGLRLLLDGADRIRVIGEAADGEEAVAQARALRPDVVLMDIRMPRLDGIRATARILEEDPDARIIMLTTFDADAEVLGALAVGATGFLVKDTPPAELIEAVHRAVRGDVPLSASVTRQVVTAATTGRDDPRRRAAADRLAELTPRELDVAQAIAAGLSNAEIAERLFLSIATVKTHASRIMEKLPAENRVQIATCVLDAGRTPAV